AVSVLPAYLRATDFGIFTLSFVGWPATTVFFVGLSLIFLAFFFLAEATARRAAGTVSVVATVTVAPSPQLTVMTSGLPDAPPPTSVPLAFSEHVGGMASTKEASAEAWGAAQSRPPLFLE